MLRVRRHGRRKQDIHGVIEPDHVESVVRLQAAEGVDEARLGLDDRDAAHRAGIVDHEDDFARHRLLLRRLDRRRGDEGEQIIGIADMLAEQSYRGRLLGHRLPGQFEIAIGRHRTFGKANDARAGVRLLSLDRVMVALDLAERKAGLQAHCDCRRIDRRILGGIEHFRRDAVAVRHRIGSGCAPAAAILLELDVLHDRRRVIARRHNHRHAQRELVAGLMHRFLIFDLHQHGLAGSDIGHRVGKDVRPLLLGQRSFLAVRLGLFVDDAGLLPLLDLADHDAVADHHLERIDRAARRQRIDIDRLDPILRRVLEDLRDAGADGRARYREIDVDAEAGRFSVAVLGLQQQRTGARFVRTR